MRILSLLRSSRDSLATHTSRRLHGLLLLIILVPACLTAGAPSLHHELKVILQPEHGRLAVIDRITLPNAVRELSFLLHDGLTPELAPADAGSISAGAPIQGPVLLRRYRVIFDTPQAQLELHYGGEIQHPLTRRGEVSSTRQSSPGIISGEGVFLAGSSYWYPVIGQQAISFHLQVQAPPGWHSVSQGAALSPQSGWQERHPQEEIYLIAAPYHRYRSAGEDIQAEVYLREDDPLLAQRYLQATQHYLAMYQQLLGDYPYAKFALVENFWESGYGMPSFTLLGPRVIRLPFIIHTSYPHEILHNWWGNGVYIDPASGNWSEGLTTYLADHLLKEQRGEGAAYRRHTLQDYASYVSRDDDFPLSEFRGNHGQISQSVGYGKTLMLFHMLRTRLGEQTFIAGLRHFYSRYRFTAAGYDQLQKVFEEVSGGPLEAFFRQWLNRTGAPALRLLEVHVDQLEGEYRTTFTLQQTQPEAPFQLQVPIFLELAGETRPELHWVTMDQRRAQISIHTRQRPLHLSVDPRFDLFRHLDPSEIPGSLGQLFGARRVLAILPRDVDKTTRNAYLELVQQWQRRQPGIEWRWDHDLEQFPGNGPVWIMGRENRFINQILPLLQEAGMAPGPDSLAVGVKSRDKNPRTLGLLYGDSSAAITGLARKLPHYGRYGYTRFSGSQPAIVDRGEWPVTQSALSVTLDLTTSGQHQPIPTHTPLIGDK